MEASASAASPLAGSTEGGGESCVHLTSEAVERLGVQAAQLKNQVDLVGLWLIRAMVLQGVRDWGLRTAAATSQPAPLRPDELPSTGLRRLAEGPETARSLPRGCGGSHPRGLLAPYRILPYWRSPE